MSPHHPPLHHPPPKNVQRIERAFRQLHQLLCLIERGAAPSTIDRAERSYQRSLKNLDVSERELVRHYPKYRLATLARQAAEKLWPPATVVLKTEELN